jgi:hypothetical protein
MLTLPPIGVKEPPLPFPLLHGMEEREFAGSWWK